RFLQFDHKHLKNIEIYNQTTPPSYPLSKISVKLHFLYGTNDFLTSMLDVEGLIRKFKTSTVAIDKFFGWNHADFLIGREAHTANRKILGVMKQYSEVAQDVFDY
ncbi:Lipase 3, partial [Pseudolycoriella hygida]